MYKKQCQMCKQTKEISLFHKSKSTKDGYGSYCAKCKYEANIKSDNKRLSKNRQLFLDQRKNWHLKQTYGITLEKYKQISKKQKGVCAICLKVDSDRSLAVDHCHETNKIRGLLCQKCNRAIGQFQDDKEILKRAIDYLNNWY